MLLCRTKPLPRKVDRTRAAIILPYFVRTFPRASAKTCYAPHPHRPPLFCPLSPEAVLLTGEKVNVPYTTIFVILNRVKHLLRLVA